MKPFIVLKLFLGLAVSFSLPAFALSTNAGPKYVSRIWQTDEGLPHNFVQAITQTDDGWLWIGTRNGLARFDGLRFTVMDQTLFPKMKTRSFTALHQGRDGAFWIGTEGSGLICRKDGATLLYTQTNGLPDNNVKTIYEAGDGSMWIGTRGGLVQFKEGKPLVTLSKTNGLPHNSVRAICEDHAGSLLIGTPSGLAVFAAGKVTMPFGTIVAASINAMVALSQSNLWVGFSKGLARMGDGTVILYSRQAGLADNFISALLADRNGRLWIGTYGGLSYLADGKFLTEPLSDEGTGDQVNCLFEDRENNLWVGTKDGLCQLRIRPVAMLNQQRGLTHNNVMSVMEDRAGSLWLGTWGGGPNRWDNTNILVMKRSLDREFILSLGQSRDGDMWFGGDYNHGLYRWSSEKPGTTRYSAADGLANTAVRVIYEDHARNLWIGTSSALELFKDGKFTRYTTADGLAGNTIRVILEDRENNLWIGTTEGLSRMKNGKLKRQNEEAGDRNQESGVTNHVSRFTTYTTRDGLSHNTVVALHEDEKGDLWIGTDGGGLNKLKIQNEKFKMADSQPSTLNSQLSFTSYTTKHGLFSDTAFEILEDNAGYFWMSCLNGIYRVKKQSFAYLDAGKITRLPCVAYGKAEGMTTPQCNGVSKPAGWKGQDGRLWFATTKGVAVIDPKNLKVNETPPSVVIEEVIADKKRIQETGDRSQESGEVSEKVSKWVSGNVSLTHSPTHPLTVPPGRGELEFHYTALSFTAPDKNRFKYKLEGFDRDWVEAETRRVAYYNNLRPGSYTFRVIACNNDGIWNMQGSSVKLSLLPHFWQTWWFFGVCGLGAVGLVGGTARYATKRKLQRQFERLEQQHAVEKERTRIAQDMHDDLGAKLSEILLVTDLSGKKEPGAPELRSLVERTAGSVRELVDNLDAIVWAVNPRNDSLEKFALYVSEYVQMYLKATSLRYSLNIPGELPERMLSSETRHNLFLVIKEALHNIVKHAQAAHVRISLRHEAGVLIVTIEDDGKGFSPERSSGFGNGVQNMEARMKNTGGSFALSSEPGKGTRVQVEIPLER